MTTRRGRLRKARATGIYVRTGPGPDDYELRSIAAGAGISVADGDGVAGAITITATGGGGGGAPTTASYVVVGLDAGLSAERRLQVGTGLSLTDGGAGGNLTVAPDLDLAAVEGLASTGLAARTAASTWATRTITTSNILLVDITDGNGAAGNPTIDIVTGEVVADGLSAVAGSGLSLSSPAGAGLPSTITTTGNLAALDDLATTGIAVRTGASTWTTRSIGVSGTGLSIANAGGVAADPTITLAMGTALNQLSTSQGAVAYRGASGWVALAPGTSGDFLRTNGAAADPSWAPASGSGGLSAAQAGARAVLGV